MARMSREFSLVLMGAGILTAGYFLLQDNDDLVAKEEKEVSQKVNNSRSGGHSHGGMIFFIRGGTYTNGRVASPTLGNTGITRGGFGGIVHTPLGAELMHRMTLDPRPNWQKRVEEHGLHFHTLRGEPYWDESAAYQLTSYEVDNLEARDGNIAPDVSRSRSRGH